MRIQVWGRRDAFCGMAWRTAIAALVLVAMMACASASLAAPLAARAYAAEPEVQGAPVVEALHPSAVFASAQSKTSSSANATAKAPKPSKKQLKAFKKASADFSMKLLRTCMAAKGKSANVTISPMSVLNALAVTANGAKGKTAKQMRAVLAGKASFKSLNKCMRWYNGKLVNSSKARLNVANSIWYHNDGSLVMKPAFLSVAGKYYGAKVAPSDFADPSTVDAINGWVADNTDGMIKRIVSSLNPDDRIAIVNALCFDAKWRVPFEKSDVCKRKFKTASGKKRTVEMMHGTEQRYIEGEGVRGFVKPYAKGYSYVALLPKKGTSLKKFVASLDGKAFIKLVTGAKRQPVRVAMPKYSLTYDNDQMERQLRAMGMGKAFTSGADFSKMANDARGKLYIGQVMHKTKIDVDEQGTKAAAATAVMMRASSAPFGKVKKVTLNRPFVYAIVDNATKLPVFVGAVNTIGK